MRSSIVLHDPVFHQKMANAFYVSACVSQRLVHEFKGWSKKLHKHDMQQLLTPHPDGAIQCRCFQGWCTDWGTENDHQVSSD